MNGAPGTRSADEIRQRFIARLNSAVLRPGMYDGESTLRQLLDDLAWIDKRESPGGVYGLLEARGAASPVGVRGVFMRMFGGGIRAHDDAVAFVYADLAHAQGYLAPQRELAAEEYSRLRRDARGWTADADRVTGDLIGEFGEPSLWIPHYNPRYPTSVAYVSRNALDPLIVFDFWQEMDQTSPAPGARRPALARARLAQRPLATGPVRRGIHLHPNRPRPSRPGDPGRPAAKSLANECRECTPGPYLRRRNEKDTVRAGNLDRWRQAR